MRPQRAVPWVLVLCVAVTVTAVPQALAPAQQKHKVAPLPGSIDFFARKGEGAALPPIPPIPPREALKLSGAKPKPSPKPQQKQTVVAAVKSNGNDEDLLQAIAQLVKEATCHGCEYHDMPKCNPAPCECVHVAHTCPCGAVPACQKERMQPEERASADAVSCSSGDCSVSRSDSPHIVTPEVVDSIEADTRADKSAQADGEQEAEDVGHQVDPVQAALLRAKKEVQKGVQLIHGDEHKPSKKSEDHSPFTDEEQHAAALALALRAKLLGHSGHYQPQHFDAGRIWRWTGPSVSRSYSSGYAATAALCDEGEDCHPVETVPKGYLG